MVRSGVRSWGLAGRRAANLNRFDVFDRSALRVLLFFAGTNQSMDGIIAEGEAKVRQFSSPLAYDINCRGTMDVFDV